MTVRLFIATLSFALAATALGQEQPAENPDYSKPTLMRIFSTDETPPERERRVKVRAGGLEFRALGMDWRVAYLPILPPLVGSRNTTSKEWPDAFSLTGTQFASPPRSWRQRRAINAELRRIDRLQKRAKVVVK